MIHKTWLQGHVLIGLNGFSPKTRTHGGKHDCRKEDSTNGLTLLQLVNQSEMFRLILSIKTGFRGSSVRGGVVRCSGEVEATTPC